MNLPLHHLDQQLSPFCYSYLVFASFFYYCLLFLIVFFVDIKLSCISFKCFIVLTLMLGLLCMHACSIISDSLPPYGL